jgi:Ser/Thr protein kinase RdoA (MazF antagonist)
MPGDRSAEEAPESVQLALHDLSERRGEKLELVGRYSSGEFGAYRVRSEAERAYVLKFGKQARLEAAQTTTAALRETGYPAPVYLALSQTGAADSLGYALQSELPGESLERLHRASLDQEALLLGILSQLLNLVGAQAGRAVQPSSSDIYIDTLLRGGDGYCLHETMRRYSTATSEMLEELIAIGRRYEDLEFPQSDVVHHDFHLGNVLADGDRVTGVVDWEGTHSGDCAFDVATLFFYLYNSTAARNLLLGELLERTGPSRAEVYLAHMAFRQVEFSARMHRPETVELYLKLSAGILTDLRRLRR